MNKERVIYKVFPEHRVVVAEIHGCAFDAQAVVSGMIKNTTASINLIASYMDERFIMNDYLKATARCHPDDIFDVEVGKKIALKKLTEAYHRSMNKHINNYMKCICNIADNMKDCLAKKHYKEEV